MTEPRFNLAFEPWVPVRIVGQGSTMLSLRDVLVRSHEITGFNVQPSAEFVLLRTLLAVLYRSLDEPVTFDLWGDLWEADTLPEKAVDSYLEQHHDRFWLDHPTAPFMQQVGLEANNGEVKDVSVLLPDYRAEKTVFSTRSGEHLKSFSWQEAALWLLHAQAYDVSGTKTGTKGDPKITDGKRLSGNGRGPGWVATLGGTYVQRKTLRETLLLNLVGTEVLTIPQDDLPSWEQPVADLRISTASTPTGPLDLLTYQQRAILLHWNEDRANGVILTYGRPLEATDLHRIEPFSSWKVKNDTWIPRQPATVQQDWGGIGQYVPLQSRIGQEPGKEGEAPRPLVYDWLSDLMQEELIPGNTLLRMVTVAGVLDTKSTVLQDVYFNQIGVPTLAIADPETARVLATVLSRAHTVAICVGWLAKNLAQSGGTPPPKKGKFPQAIQAEADFYDRLDGPLRSWLLHASPDTEQDGIELLRGTAQEVERDLFHYLPTTAWRGRKIRRGQTEYEVNPATAWRGFHADLNKALPTPTDEETS